MKKLLAVLLIALLLLSTGCYRLACTACAKTEEIAETTPEPQEPEETPAPTADGMPKPQLIQQYNAYQNLAYDQTEATLFRYDLDGDGAEEEIGISIDWENDALTVRDGSRSAVLENCCDLYMVYLCDLDPNTPWKNLIVVADWASDDYITTALHPEGDRLIDDKRIEGEGYWEDGQFWVEERTGLFGTTFGYRTYGGDKFETDSEWLDCWVPTQEEIAQNRQSYFEVGVLMHLVRDLPCTVDGQPAIITKGNCVLLVRYHESYTQAEICTEDGSLHAMVDIDFNYDEWDFLIDGVDQDEYFDNLLYAD